MTGKKEDKQRLGKVIIFFSSVLNSKHILNNGYFMCILRIECVFCTSHMLCYTHHANCMTLHLLLQLFMNCLKIGLKSSCKIYFLYFSVCFSRSEYLNIIWILSFWDPTRTHFLRINQSYWAFLYGNDCLVNNPG